METTLHTKPQFKPQRRPSVALRQTRGQAVVGRARDTEFDKEAALYPAQDIRIGTRLAVSCCFLNVCSRQVGLVACEYVCLQAADQLVVRQGRSSLVDILGAVEVNILAYGLHQLLFGRKGDASHIEIPRDLFVIAISYRFVAANTQDQTADAGQLHTVAAGKMFGQVLRQHRECRFDVGLVEGGACHGILADVMLGHLVAFNHNGEIALC